MGGGLMQLVAYGSQDIYLTGQPQITFFKSVYRRHTNFAIESIQQTINGSIDAGARVSVTISRNGDLLKNLWCQYDPSKLVSSSSGMAADISHAIFNQLELEIGGQLIDRQYGLWLTVWRDLVECNPTGAQGELTLSGQEPAVNGGASYLDTYAASTKYQRMSYTHQSGSATSTTGAPTEAYIPMRFWFCRNPGLAIPLIALQYHEVKFNIQFALASAYINGAYTSGLKSSSFAVYADYVYLDTTERRQFAQNAHEYLIDQLQFQQEAASTGTGSTIRLNFNHPVKELVWVGSPQPLVANSAAGSSYADNVLGGATPSAIVASGNAGTSVMQTKIILNGTDRFTARNIKYFTRNQIWDCHTGFGATGVADSIAVYSFALRPEEHQPSGTCNFSRIDTAQLAFSGAAVSALTIFAVNYNVLRIMSGMGGLAYSN